MTFIKIYYRNRVFQYKSLLIRKWHARSLIVVSKGEPVLYMLQINLFLASFIISSFSTVSTPMPPSSAFLYYTTIFVKSITAYWICTGFQFAGTPSTLHSKHSSPPCTGICPHHPQSFPAQGSTLF